MKPEHLSEYELQQVALGLRTTDPTLAAHASECAVCAAAIASYQAMFAAISAMEKPAFAIDIETQILAKLPVVTPAKRRFSWWLLPGVAAAGILGITLWVMSSYFKALFGGVDRMMLYLLVVTVLTITLLQCREMLVIYRKKMNLLKFY